MTDILQLLADRLLECQLLADRLLELEELLVDNLSVNLPVPGNDQFYLLLNGMQISSFSNEKQKHN